MSIKVKVPSVPIRQRVSAPTDARTIVEIATHEMVIDEPKHRHGTDMGPTPVDTMIAGLAGCTNVILNKIANEMKIPVRGLEMEIDGELDVRGIVGLEEIRRPIPALDLVIRFATDADDVQIEKLKDQLHRRCPVSIVFREAGIDIRETWDIKRS